MSATDTTTTDERALPGLEDSISGDVLRPGDRHYAASRALWNGLIDHRPLAIARTRTAEDVAAAVLCARDAGLEIAVRCGGHSMTGKSMSDGGLTIDLSQMNSVVVDPKTRRAKVGGGSLLLDVAEAAQPHGLSMPFGTVSHTGVGGLTLGGGIGWLMRRYGLALDTVRSARVVTAEGEIVTASDDENPDLFWAIRGGGGNFGIVAELEYELCPFGPESLAGMLLHPLEAAPEVLRQCRDFMDTEAPDELTVFEVFLTVPPEDPFPAELQGKPALALGLAYAGPIAEGEPVVGRLREFGRPALDVVGPMPTVALQQMIDDSSPHGIRNYDRQHWLSELPDGGIDLLVELFTDVPSPMSMLIGGRMGGAVERVPAEATAFGHRDAHRLLWIIGQWFEGDADEQRAWIERVYEAMKPHSSGVYVNALGDEGDARIRAAYKDAIWSRLVEAKRRWDPDNVFRLNQNISPA